MGKLIIAAKRIHARPDSKMEKRYQEQNAKTAAPSSPMLA